MKGDKKPFWEGAVAVLSGRKPVAGKVSVWLSHAHGDSLKFLPPDTSEDDIGIFSFESYYHESLQEAEEFEKEEMSYRLAGWLPDNGGLLIVTDRKFSSKVGKYKLFIECGESTWEVRMGSGPPTLLFWAKIYPMTPRLTAQILIKDARQ